MNTIIDGLSNLTIYSETKIDNDYINNRIKNEICYDTINILKDDCLINVYKECKSVKLAINKLKVILAKYNIENNIQDEIIEEYIIDIIPPGTKASIRGNKFNNIIKTHIINLNLNSERFEICFEKQCDLCITTEIPDWYILEKLTCRIIIGMYEVDLWSGGQQLNRGSKYLIDNKINTCNSKLLCVICNEKKFKNNKSKSYELFKTGYSNDTLCYIKNLGSIIDKYFN